MKRALLPLTITFVAAIFLGVWLIVPNVMTAMNRSRQHRTMADMRMMATALEARAGDTGSYSFGPVRREKAPVEQRVSLSELARALEPKYVRKVPLKDGWGTPYQVSVRDYDAAGRPQTYIIRSLGSDGRPDRVLNLASGATTKFADDLIYSNGSFIRYPEGAG
jgi:type II secretory pathway pseudopilin PulG